MELRSFFAGVRTHQSPGARPGLDTACKGSLYAIGLASSIHVSGRFSPTYTGAVSPASVRLAEASPPSPRLCGFVALSAPAVGAPSGAAWSRTDGRTYP